MVYLGSLESGDDAVLHSMFMPKDAYRGLMSIALAAGVALFAGCAAPAPKIMGKYVPPSSGPTAKLVMRGAVPAGEFFTVNTFDDSEKCEGYRVVGTGNATRTPASTTLAANVVTTVEFRVDKPAKRQLCATRFTFTPVAGKTYLLRGGSTATGCGALVMDMTNPENIKPEPTVLRRNPKGLACLPISKSKASSVATPEAGENNADAVLRQGAGTEDLQGLIDK